MKKVMLALIILAIIITGGSLEDRYIHTTFETLNESLCKIENLIEAEDDESLIKVQELSTWWEEKRMYMELFAFSPDVRAFSVALAETKGSLMSGDYQNALSKCLSLIVMADNIEKLLDFNAEDII